jgi:hypothetical protein
MSAVLKGHLQVVKCLLRAGADREKTDKVGNHTT